MPNRIRDRLGLRAATVLLAALALTQLGMLYRRNPKPPSVVTPGAHYGRIAVVDKGIPVSLDFARVPACTFVVFMMPTCPTCEHEASRWATAFGDSGSWNGIVVSFADWASSREFADSHKLSAPLFAVENDRMDVVHALHVPSVPTLVVMGTGGVVKSVAAPGASLDSLAHATSCPRRAPVAPHPGTTAASGP
ncbi:MAG TPA: hypothetical protein VN706_16450 [Gemmatimonadaceae bacterium]|nr:hypothetical protein [Gemmatimonadaceae bacterium]